MVMTHKGRAEMSRKPIVFKDTDKSRMFMSKSEVLLQNEQARKKQELMAEAEAKINAELGLSKKTKVVSEPVVDNSLSKEDVGIKKEIKALEEKYHSLKGPGSKAKKEEIASQIQQLESQLPADKQF